MSLSKRLAFYLQASIILFFLAGSIAPTPLYVVYQAAWGFSPVTITVIFGSYAFAVLGSLLVTGSIFRWRSPQCSAVYASSKAAASSEPPMSTGYQWHSRHSPT